MKKFITLSLIGLFLAGCGGNVLSKSCKSLTEASEYFNTASIQAQAAHLQDPNLISEDDLMLLEEIREIISSAAGTTCSLEQTIDLID